MGLLSQIFYSVDDRYKIIHGALLHHYPKSCEEEWNTAKKLGHNVHQKVLATLSSLQKWTNLRSFGRLQSDLGAI